MMNCAFRPLKLYLEFLDCDKMRLLLEKSMWNIWRQINERQSWGFSNDHFQRALTYSAIVDVVSTWRMWAYRLKMPETHLMLMLTLSFTLKFKAQVYSRIASQTLSKYWSWILSEFWSWGLIVLWAMFDYEMISQSA